MTAPIRFLSRDAVIALHRESLAVHGGVDGMRDAGLFDSAMLRCVNRAAHRPDAPITELAASLAHGLAMNRPFNDGNERIAMIAAFGLLEINGWRVTATELDAHQAFVGVAAGQMTEAELAGWLARVSE